MNVAISVVSVLWDVGYMTLLLASIFMPLYGYYVNELELWYANYNKWRQASFWCQTFLQYEIISNHIYDLAIMVVKIIEYKTAIFLIFSLAKKLE